MLQPCHIVQTLDCLLPLVHSYKKKKYIGSKLSIHLTLKMILSYLNTYKEVN